MIFTKTGEQTEAELSIRDSQVYVAFCASEFPMYIRPKDLIPLWKDSKIVNKKLRPEFRNKMFKTWLNETTIDAIVMMSTKAQETLHGVYLGSSFNLDTLSQSSARYVSMVQTELIRSNRVVMTLNTGSHWVLLHFECWCPETHESSSQHATRSSTRKSRSKAVCTLYDPMATSSLASQILIFAAKVCGKEVEFEAVTGTYIRQQQGRRSSRDNGQKISVRAQLSKYQLSFFKLVNVGVQLSQKEGYNCGT